MSRLYFIPGLIWGSRPPRHKVFLLWSEETTLAGWPRSPGGAALGGPAASELLTAQRLRLSHLDCRWLLTLFVAPQVIDCCTRELLGWHLSSSGRSRTAEAALEQALIARFGTLGRVPAPFLLRSDNGLVFISRSYAALVRSYGLRQEFITPHTPEQNGMVERVIRTLKDQCVHRHRFETLQHASRVIGDWITF